MVRESSRLVATRFFAWRLAIGLVILDVHPNTMMVARPKVAILTREYPPEIYGGAGVHVDYLARALASRVPLTVHAFGADRPDDARPPVRSYRPWDALRADAPYAAALETISVDLAFVAGVDGASLVHSHTWYAN